MPACSSSSLKSAGSGYFSWDSVIPHAISLGDLGDRGYSVFCVVQKSLTVNQLQ